MSHPGKGESEEVRRIAERAIRRLDLLEYAILAAAALLSLVGGALVAFLLRAAAGLPFGATWTVMSLLFFVVPAVGTWLRARREERRDGDHEVEGYRTDEDHG